MNFRLTQTQRLPSLLKFMLLIFVPLAVFLLYVLVQRDVPTYEYLDDPVGYIGRAHYGIGSNIGILLWCAAAALCLFCGAILREGEFARFLKYSGIVTTILLVDDLFLLHDKVIPLNSHVHQQSVFFGFGVMLALYLFEFRRTLLKTELLPLVVAFGFLGLSLFMDEGVERGWLGITYTPLGYVAEDGSKLLGIAGWFMYFARVCWWQMAQAIHERTIENRLLEK